MVVGDGDVVQLADRLWVLCSSCWGVCNVLEVGEAVWDIWHHLSHAQLSFEL